MWSKCATLCMGVRLPIRAGRAPTGFGSTRRPWPRQGQLPVGSLISEEPKASQPARQRSTAGSRRRARSITYRVSGPRRWRETIRIQVQAAALGSWLDSVVTLRDAQGRLLAENDDAGDLSVLGWEATLAPSLPTFRDSALDYEPTADGEIQIEVADRYGAGGPEYPYRLRVGPAQPDFAIALRPEAFSRLWNLKPGSTTAIPFRITMEGRTGPIVVAAEGLPAGVSAEPVRVNVLAARPGLPPRPGARPCRIIDGNLVFEVANDAAPAVGAMQVIANAEIEPDKPPLTRVASALLPLDVTMPAEGINRPSRIVSHFLVAVTGAP